MDRPRKITNSLKIWAKFHFFSMFTLVTFNTVMPITWHSNLRKEGFILAHSLKDIFIHDGNGMTTGVWNNRSHYINSQVARKTQWWCLCFLLSIQLRMPANMFVPFIFRLGHFTSIKPLWKCTDIYIYLLGDSKYSHQFDNKD